MLAQRVSSGPGRVFPGPDGERCGIATLSPTPQRPPDSYPRMSGLAGSVAGVRGVVLEVEEGFRVLEGGGAFGWVLAKRNELPEVKDFLVR